MTDGSWGISLNGLDLTGVVGQATFKALDVENWAAGPGSTGDSIQNQYGDGGWVNEAFDTDKRLIIPGTIKGPDRESVRSGFDLLNSLIPRKDLRPLVVDEDGLVRHTLVRLDQPRPDFKYLSDRLGSFTIQLVAPRGRKLAGDGSGPTTLAGPVGLPKVEGGLRLVPPGVRYVPGGVRIVATVRSGQIVLGTAGNATPPVLLRIRGPIPDFTITATLGDTIQVQRYTEAVPAGQFVDIDLDKRLVRINGTVSRRNKLIGPWITPADGMTFKFESSAQNDTASMELFASSAWR
ncbi:hypothetical protein ABC337_15185 [Arthrobacter sp. 1P04PC]|uniref:hypothetical protein n=1 Tax=unclassified Arthrobacter TaxID=235627 RepID=UPI0039A335F1